MPKLTQSQQKSQKRPSKHHQNKTQKMPIKRKPPPEKLSKKLLPTNKPGKQEAIKMSTTPKRNTGTRVKTKRMTSVSTEEFKPTVV